MADYNEKADLSHIDKTQCVLPLPHHRINQTDSLLAMTLSIPIVRRWGGLANSLSA